MNINFTPFLQALIGLLSAFITYRLIPYIKAKTSNEQRTKLASAIRVAVFAAEQIYGAGHGSEKMNYALTRLREKGYEIDRGDVEAAVYQYLNVDAIVGKLIAGQLEGENVTEKTLESDNKE